MRTYYLRTSKSDGKASLYTRILSRKNNFRVQLNTGVSVDVASWRNAEKKSAGKANKSVWDFMPSEIKKMVEVIDDAITLAMEQPDCTKESVEAAVSNVRYADAIESNRIVEEQEKAKKQAEEERKKADKAKADADVISYLENLIEGMKNGDVRISGKGQHKGERYTAGTIKMWNNLLGILRRFMAKKKFTWKDIDQKLANRFVGMLEDEGYMAKTRNKYVGEFVALINRAGKEGKHDNTKATEYFSKPKVDESKKATEVYLTADELQGLFDLQLSGLQEKVRDIFLIGVYTCQRVGDFSRLKESNFTTTPRGTQIIELRQQKTGTLVKIPILNQNLITLAEKYGYNLPSIPDQIINRYIKDICRMLADKMPTMKEEFTTLLTMKEKAKEERGETTYKRNNEGEPVKEKWEMITTHTARRTGITLMYLSGKFDTRQMMHLTGHKELKTFDEYIKLSGDDVADDMQKIKGDEDIF